MALAVTEGIFALLGLWTAQALLRHHVREFRKGMREGACERTAGGHAWRPWLRRCRACGCEEDVEDDAQSASLN